MLFFIVISQIDFSPELRVGQHAEVRGSVGRPRTSLVRVQELRGRRGDAGLRRRQGELRGRGPRSGARRLPWPLSVRGGRAAAPGGLLGPGAPGHAEQPERVHLLPVSQRRGLLCNLLLLDLHTWTSDMCVQATRVRTATPVATALGRDTRMRGTVQQPVLRDPQKINRSRFGKL